MGRVQSNTRKGAALKRRPIPVDAERPQPLDISEIRLAEGEPGIAVMLLRVAQERLARAVELERSCGLPIAETSVIAHDVHRLARACRPPGHDQPAGKGKAAAPVDDAQGTSMLDDFLE